jgi:hypothetical protein
MAVILAGLNMGIFAELIPTDESNRIRFRLTGDF